MQPSFAMLMKKNVEKMSAYRSLAMLMKTIELKQLSRDVDEKKGTWLKPEVENGEEGVRQRPFGFYPRVASAVRWCGCQGTFGKHPSGFGPRMAPDGSLTSHLTKPRTVGIVNRQVCVRGRKSAMPSLPQSGLLSLLGVLIQQNVAAGDRPRKKDVNLIRSKPECA